MKKLLSLFLTLAIMSSLAMSASAAEFKSESTRASTFNLYSTSSSNLIKLDIYNQNPRATGSSYLNCRTDGEPYAGVYVTAAEYVYGDHAQDWVIYRGQDNLATLRPYHQYTSLVLARNTNGRAKIIQFFGSEYSESKVVLDELESTGFLGGWRISLLGKDSYVDILTSGYSDGQYDVGWNPLNTSDTRNVWYIYRDYTA